MPKFKKLSVDVINGERKALEPIGTEIDISNSLCETYIISQAGMQFGVAIEPDDDFFSPLIQIDKHVSPGKGGGNRPENYPNVNPSEWHLLAEVYLDGRHKPAATSIIYLPWHVRAEERIMDSSFTWNLRDEAVERLWYFQEVGLENFVKTLSINNSNDANSANTPVRERGLDTSRNDLSEMMQNLKTERSNQDPHVSKPGQIEVVLTKIKIMGLESSTDQSPGSESLNDRRSVVDEGQQTDVGDSSHFIQIKEAYKVNFSRKRHHYQPMEQDPFARFIFNYRSAEQLMRMKVLQKKKQTSRGIEQMVPYLRPLTFGEHDKPYKLTESSDGSKEFSTKAGSFLRSSNQCLMAQQIKGFSLKGSSSVSGSSGKPEALIKLTKSEGFLHPTVLEEGSKGFNQTAERVEMSGLDGSGDSGSTRINGSTTTEALKNLSLYDSPGGEIGPEGELGAETPASLTHSLDKAYLKEESLIEPPTVMELESDASFQEPSETTGFTGGHQENPQVDAQNHLRAMSTGESWVTNSLEASVAPSYQSPQMMKRYYSSEDEEDIKEPDNKKSCNRKNIERIAADDTSMNPREL